MDWIVYIPIALLAAAAVWILRQQAMINNIISKIIMALAEHSKELTRKQEDIDDLCEEVNKLREQYEAAVKAQEATAEAEAELAAEQLKSERLFQQGMSNILNYDYRAAAKGGTDNE